MCPHLQGKSHAEQEQLQAKTLECTAEKAARHALQVENERWSGSLKRIGEGMAVKEASLKRCANDEPRPRLVPSARLPTLPPAPAGAC